MVRADPITKAKEIIKSLISILELIDGKQIYELSEVKEAECFLNGEVEKCLELNKGIKWHKVAEKLPPLWKGSRQASIRVVDNYDRIIIYDYGSERWRDLEGDSLGIQPDYWCEIPKYTEEYAKVGDEDD